MKMRLPLLLGCLLAVGLAIGACRKEEQNRPLQFDKGTYLGEQDQSLTEDQLGELRNRARAQQE